MEFVLTLIKGFRALFGEDSNQYVEFVVEQGTQKKDIGQCKVIQVVAIRGYQPFVYPTGLVMRRYAVYITHRKAVSGQFWKWRLWANTAADSHSS